MDIVKIHLCDLIWRWEDGQNVHQISRLELFVQLLKDGIKIHQKPNGTVDHEFQETRSLYDDVIAKGQIENYLVVDSPNSDGQYPVEIGNQRLTILKAGVLPNVREVDCCVIPKGKTWADVIARFPYKKVEGFRTPPWTG